MRKCSSLFLLLYVLVVSPSLAQSQHQEISGKQAASDIRQLIQLVDDIHINPYVLYPDSLWKDELQKLILQFEKKASVSRSDVFISVLPHFFKLRDIHLSLSLPLKNNDYLKNRKHYLLMKVRILDDCLYYTGSFYTQIPFGSQIISINGVSAEEIIQKMLLMSPSEGMNPETQSLFAERNFLEYFPLVYHVQQSNKIQFIEPGGNNIVETYAEGKIPTKQSGKKGVPPKTPNYFKIQFYDNWNTAYIAIESFSHGSTQEYKDFLQFTFTTIWEKGVQNLIIDLRNNEGGYAERGEKLLSFLISEETPFVESIIYKNSRLADSIYDRLSKNSMLLKRMNILDEVYRLKSNPYGYIDTVFYAKSQPAPHHVFLGRVYVLINGMSISTTGLFCNSLRICY